MKLLQLETKLENVGISKPRFICHNIDNNTWFALIVNTNENDKQYSLCIILDEFIEDAPYILTFYNIDNGWEKNDNYNLLLANSLMRQMDRCLDNCALVSENLFVYKSGGVKHISWAKGIIDHSKMFTLVHSLNMIKKNDLIWDKEKCMNRIYDSMNRRWSDGNLNKIRDKIVGKLEQRTNLSKREDSTLVQDDLKETELVNGERLIFDSEFFDVLKSKCTHKLTELINSPI